MIMQWYKSTVFPGAYYVKVHFPWGVQLCGIAGQVEPRKWGDPAPKYYLPDTRVLSEITFRD